MNSRPLVYRRAWPVLAVSAGIAAVLLFCSSCATSPSVMQQGAGKVASALLPQVSQAQEGASVIPGFEVSDEWLDGYSSEVPADFRSELLNRSDAVCSEQGNALSVGFSATGSAEEVQSALAEELALRGWTEVGSGQAAVSTFVKSGGSYRWAAVTCTEVGDSVSVVVSARRYGDE